MSRFFFRFERDDQCTCPYEVHLPCLAAVQQWAQIEACNMTSPVPPRGFIPSLISIADEGGNVLSQIPVQDALALHPQQPRDLSYA